MNETMRTEYVAADLLDIAEDFEERARACRERVKSATRQRDKRRGRAEGDTWDQAAEILRRTTLKEVGS